MTGSKPPFGGPAGIINPGLDKVGFIPAGDIETQQHAELLTAAATAVVRVAIRPPFQVVHDRQRYLPGQTTEVPAHVAQRWVRNRWATVVEQTDDDNADRKPRGRK